MTSSWTVSERTGTAAYLHARFVPQGTLREVWVHTVTRPALVLGSTQSLDIVDHAAAEAAGIDVVRRRSGGGAVLVEDGGAVWVDVVIPTDDPLWDDDVGRASHWVGEAWARALHALGDDAVEVHRGGLVRTPWSALVCFGGLGPGEVTVGGRKAVGLAQRRTREGARFQTAALTAWDPERLLGLLHMTPATRTEALADLADRAVALRSDADDLVDAFVTHLPTRRGRLDG